MANHAGRQGPGGLTRELIVPLIMLAGVGFYLFDARNISLAGLIFPLALIAVVVGTCGAIMARALMKGPEDHPSDQGGGRLTAPKPWLLAFAPVVLIAFWERTGAFFALAAMVFAAQLILGAQSVWRSALYAVLVTLPIYLLFKNVFYVRFPIVLF